MTDDAYEQLAQRNAELEEEKAILAGELEDAKKHREHLQAIADMVGESDDIGATWESVNALREERDSLRRLTEKRHGQHVALISSIQANMQAVHNAASQLMMASSCDEADEALVAMNQAMSEHPIESLARRDADIAIEALRKAEARLWRKSETLPKSAYRAGYADSAKIIAMEIDELRRQAEGGA